MIMTFCLASGYESCVCESWLGGEYVCLHAESAAIHPRTDMIGYPWMRSSNPQISSLPPPSGQQVIEEQRRRLAELKQRAAVEAQCQWDALHGSQTHLYAPSHAHGPPMVHHSILHHQPPSAGEQPYDTLSLESSDSMDTSVSTGNNSACSPDNMSRSEKHTHAYPGTHSHWLISAKGSLTSNLMGQMTPPHVLSDCELCTIC